MLTKGDHTRAAILDQALRQASRKGFESLTIGGLAEVAGLSKSGVFAHFGSREELQVAAIELAAARFTEVVFLPALKAKRGLPRLQALFDRWVEWTERAGLGPSCPMQAAGIEFSDTPGPVRDAVVEHFARLEKELSHAVRLAVAQGHLASDLDVPQFVFELMGIVLSCAHGSRLLQPRDARERAKVAFDRLVSSNSPV